MRTYTRARIPGACYFFTVTLAERGTDSLLVQHVDHLRQAFRLTHRDHPFIMDAAVVLPDHLHCLWTLPPDDADFSMRWQLIKARFSHFIAADERISASRKRKGERGIWQRRFWEHVIRDELDFERHMDYIHYYAVKHGYVEHVRDWPHSSFHRCVKRGLYPQDWGASALVAELDTSNGALMLGFAALYPSLRKLRRH